MAAAGANAGRVLLLITSIGLMWTVSGSFFYCESSLIIQRLLLSQCLWEQGLTQISFSSSSLNVLCAAREKFTKAFRCQMQFLTRCHPDRAQQAPSADLDGIPTFLEGLCSTPRFNRECYDDKKRAHNLCILNKMDKSLSKTQTPEDMCTIMDTLSAECVNQVLKPCGDVTVAALIKHLPSIRPSRCLADA
ncbi:hypothetical protein Bpfe_028531 [Biomphalaria pfeifferi]|uniref:Uncharacterized protein n=1 Tax=Biomphalaria pfeifferi TaxID=112525 RepID=A0AAD8AUD0_BIOPF|nr:hypothetical protein Bpfe_028531 [Biomphalaria pfeifferi]